MTEIILTKDAGQWGKLVTCHACAGNGISPDFTRCYECSGQGELFEEWHARKTWCLDPNRPRPMDAS